MTFTLNGKVSSDEGKIMIANKAAWVQFLSDNKGKSIVGTFEVFTGNDNAGMVKLYHAYILPEIQNGFYGIGDRWTLEDIDEFLRQSYFKPFESLSGLSTIEIKQYFDWLIQWSVENLSTILNI